MSATAIRPPTARSSGILRRWTEPEGVFGWLMKQMKFPRPPLVLGLVLGEVVERYMFISIQRYGITWFSRPIVIVLFAIALWGLVRPLLQDVRSHGGIGKMLGGFAGDTLASALLAGDKVLIGRSFKYHRPRGIVAAGIEEPNALFTLGEGATTEPNVAATMVDLAEEGMTMLVVTHEMGFARQVADRVVFMDAGQIIESNAPDEFFAHPQHARTKLFLSQILR